MKKVGKHLLISLTILCSCQAENEPDNQPYNQPINYIILLDLSDRLLADGQDQRDIPIIQGIYDEFTKQVRKNLVINSLDRFQVLIAPQKKVNYNPANYQNRLYLNMRSIDPALKLNTMEDFSNELEIILKKLYKDAYQGKRNENYSGSDIWRFFNESLSYVIDSKYDNYLVVLTDGYFDFEDYSHQLAEEYRYPSSSFLKEVRGNVNWSQILDEKDMGLIPIKTDFNGLSIIVAEVNPKYDFQYESGLLEYTWKKWCLEMNISDFTFIQRTSLPQVINITRDVLNRKK